MAKKTGTSNKKRVVKVEAYGEAHISSTFNNVIITLTNGGGQVISWSSAGKMGFRGSKKNTPYAAQVAAADCAKTAFDAGLRKVKAFVKGPGAGRESAIRTIHGAGIEGTEIVDVTPLPHNGCRPKGRRRVYFFVKFKIKRIWQDLPGRQQKLPVNLESRSSAPIIVMNAKVFLRGNTEWQERGKNPLSMAFS